MKLKILAGATALAVAAAMTSGAMASDHRGAGSHHWRHHHHFADSYGGRDAAPYYGRGAYTNLGPLGVMFGPPPRPGYCGPNCVSGSSIAAWSW
jgi:hypothetical protein